MNHQDQVARLKADLEIYRDRVMRAVEDIREILSDDLEIFFMERVKAAFVSDLSVARGLSDEQIRALKARASQDARAARVDILRALEAPELWLEPGDVGEDPRGLAANPRVWECVARVGEAIRAALTDHGLPVDEAALVYREPKRFIRSRLLTNVMEKYWKVLDGYRGSLEEIDALNETDERESLAARWDGIDLS
jgi:hypothetical protein